MAMMTNGRRASRAGNGADRAARARSDEKDQLRDVVVDMASSSSPSHGIGTTGADGTRRNDRLPLPPAVPLRASSGSSIKSHRSPSSLSHITTAAVATACSPAALPATPSEVPIHTRSSLAEKALSKDRLNLDPSGSKEAAINPDADEADDGEDPFARSSSYRKWLVLLGCFMMSCCCMGYGMAWGALQVSLVARPNGQLATEPESVVSLVGSVFAFICVGVSPISGRLADRYGYRPVLLFGICLAILTLCLSAISTKLWHFFLTNGVLWGISQSAIVPLILALPSQWFAARQRSMATGLVGAGAGLGGSVNSIVVRLLVKHFRGRIKYPEFIFAGIFAVFYGLGWLLVKERRASSNPLTPTSPARLRVDSRYYILWAGICLSTFGYLPPFSYIATYTQQQLLLSPSSLTSAWPLFAMNLGLFFGRLAGGHVADRVLGPIQTLTMCFEVAGLLLMIAWHFATTMAGIVVFSAAYGAVGGAALSLVPPVLLQLYGGTQQAKGARGSNFAALVGLTIMATAPGQLAGPPLAGVIQARSGGGWIGFQIFTGASQCAGGLLVGWVWWKSLGWRFSPAQGGRKVLAKV